MKKRILQFIAIIISIILLFAVIIYMKKNKNKDFPHYKQALLKLEGSMFVIKDAPFSIPLMFIDSNEWSEMASTENIKSLEIIDDKGEKLDIKKWNVETKRKDSRFTLRNLNVEVVSNKEGIIIPKTVILTYKDNKSKEYNFGDFHIVCKNNDYYQNNIYPLNIDINPIITTANSDEFPYSGISIFIPGDKQAIEVENIDLGIKSFGINSESLKCFNLEYNLNTIINFVEEGLKKNEKWAEDFRSIKLVDNLNNNIKPFKLEPTEKPNVGSNIVIPLTRLKGSDMGGIKIFNFKVSVKINGEKKDIIKFQPFYVIPMAKDNGKLYNYLQEAGI